MGRDRERGRGGAGIDVLKESSSCRSTHHADHPTPLSLLSFDFPPPPSPTFSPLPPPSSPLPFSDVLASVVCFRFLHFFCLLFLVQLLPLGHLVVFILVFLAHPCLFSGRPGVNIPLPPPPIDYGVRPGTGKSEVRTPLATGFFLVESFQ